MDCVRILKSQLLRYPRALLLIALVVIGLVSLYNAPILQPVFSQSAGQETIEIWGLNASIGDYLWSHILEGKKVYRRDGIRSGSKMLNGANFTYRSGPVAFRPSSRYIIVVFDGSSEALQKEAQKKLNDLRSSQQIDRIVLVVLGNPDCHNDWMSSYLRSRGGFIDAIFLIRGSTFVDNTEIFPWPIGVYKDFPFYTPMDVGILAERPYACSYVGTGKLEGFDTSQCYVVREKESIGEYFQILSDSDMSLCPGGRDSHRIYEALSLGSVPVILLNSSKDPSCEGSTQWLEQLKAPVVVIKSPDEFQELLAKEKRLNSQEKIARRASVVNWYSDFRHRLGEKFLSIVTEPS